MPKTKSEEEKQLEEQVRHAEEHGQFDTAHHAMLRRLKQQQRPEPTAKMKHEKEESSDGKHNLS